MKCHRPIRLCALYSATNLPLQTMIVVYLSLTGGTCVTCCSTLVLGIVLYCIALYCVVLRSDIALWCCTPKAAKPIFITRLIKYYFLIQNTTIFYVHAVSHQLSDYKNIFDVTSAIWYRIKYFMLHQAFDITKGLSCHAKHLLSCQLFLVTVVTPGIWWDTRHFMSHQAFDVPPSIAWGRLPFFSASPSC